MRSFYATSVLSLTLSLCAAGFTATPANAAQKDSGLHQVLPKKLSFGTYPVAEGFDLQPRAFVSHSLQRAKLLALRAITLPAHFWPFNQLIRVIAHGEPFTGLGPRSATKVAEDVANEGGSGVVIGRLSPSYRDVWTVREAEKSFASLVDHIVLAKQKNQKIDASLAFDPDSFGLNMVGATPEEGERIATAGMMRIARYAASKGVPIEIDSINSEALPVSLRIAKKIVSELKVPVRIALAARFRETINVLEDWVDFAKQTKMKLGVRLVKGSYLEAKNPKTINMKQPLLKRYKQVVRTALERSRHIDVAVATQNDEMWQYTQKTAQALGADFSVQVIRGVNPRLQALMRTAGKISREYVSYGVDAPIFGITEALQARKQKKLIQKQLAAQIY